MHSLILQNIYIHVYIIHKLLVHLTSQMNYIHHTHIPTVFNNDKTFVMENNALSFYCSIILKTSIEKVTYLWLFSKSYMGFTCFFVENNKQLNIKLCGLLGYGLSSRLKLPKIQLYQVNSDGETTEEIKRRIA